MSLRPCPHCGGRARTVSAQVAEDCTETWGECQRCGARGEEVEDAYSDHATAAQSWNAGVITKPRAAR